MFWIQNRIDDIQTNSQKTLIQIRLFTVNVKFDDNFFTQ